MQARCVCGGVTVDLPGPSFEVFACHCIECQRRTGAPFGVGAYYPAEKVLMVGATTEFARPTDAGGTFRSYFGPTCGTSVLWETTGMPGMIGVAVGAIDGFDHPRPTRSLWERSRQPWATLGGEMEHSPRGLHY